MTEYVEGMDFSPIRRVFDAFLALSGAAMALISPSGKVLAASNWQPVCERFYRAHPETRRCCEESDRGVRRSIVESLASGGSESVRPYSYRCANGLQEIAQPLFIEGVHWVTVYLGQFLYEGEETDEARLAQMARRYGWDEAAFIAAYRAVPRFSKQEVERTLAFCVALSDIVSKLEYSAQRERDLALHYREAQDALTETLAQKDLLFVELQHRVKNSLTLIASLLSIESSSLNDERLRSILDEAQGRIRSVALLYERLYETGSVDSIDLGDYAVQAASSVVQGLSDAAAPPRFETDCVHQRIDTRRAIYLGLVIHELAANALRHAFPEGGPGRFRLSLRVEDGAVILIAADDGVGLPAGFSFEGRTSLGVLIVKTLAKQLGGSVEAGSGLEGGAGPGASFTLRFPL